MPLTHTKSHGRRWTLAQRHAQAARMRARFSQNGAVTINAPTIQNASTTISQLLDDATSAIEKARTLMGLAVTTNTKL